MNLYKLHSNPDSLLHHDEALDKVPHVFWDTYKNNHEELRKREKQIAQDPKYAYLYAEDVLKGPFKAGEAAIAKDPFYAYMYALCVLEGPFKAGEAAIATNPDCAYWYARDILKGPFYLDGKLIAKP